MTTIYISDKEKLPERKAFDLYATEWNLIRAALGTFAPKQAFSILDIAAGDGRWGIEAQRLTKPTCLIGVDVRPLPQPSGFSEWYTADFLEWNPARPVDLIVSNPPYRFAERIIRHAWDMLSDGGTMIMLLRLAFQAGVKRGRGLWQDCPLVSVGVCSLRPSFYGGGTNGTDYGIYHWIKGQGTPGRWDAMRINHQRGGES